ncbi:MAG TPA: pyrroloquinoline quinone biosynthesis peptide chaperone PqqD [Candidatus Thiothrix moscowensis]|uniref:pyrroloquinoline quinone biosynthesis peptide chaperone PqqD n=1 Tax=unclassified Thiothrix TaxID=2636184 RepID=UPI0025EE4D9F|nr:MULTISPECIES: pyrroloquinoline quinone biosynthesis peptide chaperone PqqD [unclassified Thiothrix]HRJ52688.1 pyrroloquinoline quinone biosynthesis peptide chaperone PqqD [Candidatus Thiothrix moscowensis]HRJ92828.1 pyrroloquinoline quinone biosynthesis peptide chaperone PqqD [Candidatus Thiothrix moscowensis]
MPDLDAKPALAPGYRFQWEPVQGCHVLLYPEGMVQLNETAAAILSFCDGQRNILRVIADLENEYAAEGLREDVLSFLAEAVERGWVRYA